MFDSAQDLKLKQIWTSQLYREYDSICWNYRVKLVKPILELVEARSFLGKWDAGLRTIKVSVNLIRNRSWDQVVNILKHEMAHQIVSDLFKSDQAHGEMFQRACEMIGVPVLFRGARADLAANDNESEAGFDSPGHNHKMLNKVRKLLALARSGNEHEAFAATRKVNEIIARYNLRRVGQDEDSSYNYRVINHRKKRIENYQRLICSILSDFFFVEIIFAGQYDAALCRTNKVINLLGTEENVLIAEYIYYFLFNNLPLLWEKHALETKEPVSRKRSYWLGVLSGFREKLAGFEPPADVLARKNGKENLPITVSAVVCAGDSGLQDFKRMLFPRLFTRRGRPSNVFGNSYQAGITAGRELNVSRAIAKREGFLGNLLVCDS
ncbi:MAG: SprT-like domain-containing protein [Proteobacteria bacterium]|nr:SprT-like domain-containing protein [Pseudomonadota bacterium]MBU1709968.1 SprT-like domain-containing protein [Pseudomonadota bacterium]